MFTGIVADVGEVLSVEERAEGLRRLTIACAYDPASIAIGASVSCSGVCMTAVATNVFVTEAMWKRDLEVIGALLPSFATPKPFA